jgi:hypothetical protein
VSNFDITLDGGHQCHVDKKLLNIRSDF